MVHVSQDFDTSRVVNRMRLGPLTALALLLVLFVAATPAFAQIAGSGLSANTPYRVGVDYHATTTDFINGTFISSYHLSGVRATVVAQLQTMANSGASVIRTTLWQVGGGQSEPWRLSFPLSSLELTNIAMYATDVANTRRPDGSYLDLQFTLGWLGCADYTTGSPSSTVGSCGHSWFRFVENAHTTIHTLVPRLAPITQPTGRRAVSRIYAEMEVMIGAKAKQDQFLKDVYPYFLNETAAGGIEGSLYFWVTPSEGEILDNNYVDSQYSALNQHKSLYWVYRSMAFMASAGLPLPKRLDFSFYPDAVTVPYAQLVNRVFADVQAVFPGYRSAVAETHYLADSAKRAELGQAFGLSFLARGIPEEVSFWTTPVTGTTGFGPPFDLASYQLTIPAGSTSSITATPNPCVVPLGQSSCPATIAWSTTAPSATAAVWITPAGGSSTLAACGKSGQSNISLAAGSNYTVAVEARPICDASVSSLTGVQVASAQVTVSAAAGCTYSLSAAGSGVLPSNFTSGAVTVTTSGGCAWTATASQSWIHTNSSGSGSGTVSYTVDANPGAARSGTILIAGQSYSVTQAAGSQGGAVISLDPGTVYQTMRGWEATAPSFRFTSDAFMQQVVDAGINRVRLEVYAGSENTVDYYAAWQATLGGVETSDPIKGSSAQADAFIANMYRTVNDNGDPNSVNQAGFFFTMMDDSIRRTVNPMRAKLAARGERLHVNLCYVAFSPVGVIPIHADPAEYAELMLAAFKHIETTFGWVPDSIELMLEPDNEPEWWNGTSMGQRLMATQARLATAGYHPDFIGPSTTDTHNAWFFVDDMIKVPGVTSYLKELSYHRYAESAPNFVAGVGSRAAALGIGGSMLEWWTPSNTYHTLHEDLTLGRSSAWQRGVVQPLSNEDYYGFLRHYFSHVRMGAQRIGATTSDGNFDPVAFINTNGTYAVVIKAAGPGAINVPGLPAGTYGIRYTTPTATDIDAGSQTIGPGGTVSASIPGQGVLVVFGGSVTNPTPPPGAPGSFFKSNPAAASTVSQSTAATLTWTSSNGATAYEYCIDTVDDDKCSAAWVSAGAATSATVTGLNGGTNYYWQVRATNANTTTYADGNPAVFWRFATVAGVAGPGSFGKASPANGATNQLATTALTWGASSGASGYEYCLDSSLNNACDTAWVSTGAAQLAAISGLTPGTTYSWQVRAVNSGGTALADGSAFWSFTTAPAACAYALGSSGAGPFPASGSSGSVSVTTGTSCSWTALADQPWIHTFSGGTGSGTITYTVDANPDGPRSGTIAAGGQTYVISQAAAACTYTLGAAGSGTLAPNAGGGAVSLTTGNGCAWAATANQTWIHTTSAGSGSGTVTFTVDANGGASRSGTITVGGQSFSVVQASASAPGAFVKIGPAAGAASISPVAAILNWTLSSGAAGYSYCIDAVDDDQCSTAWIDVGNVSTTTLTGLNGNTKYFWQVRATNAVATTYAEGSSFFFWAFTTGAAPACTYTLSSSSSGMLPAAAGNGTVSVTAGNACPWTATANQSWIHTTSSGSGNGTVSFTVDANVAGTSRSGAITIAGQTFQIDQAAFPTQKAELTSPAGGSTLTSSTVTFAWTGGVGVTKYALRIGTTFGVFDILDREVGTSLSYVATPLPTDGRTLYVRLDSEIFGVWQSNNYTVTAANAQLPQKAELTTPAPSSTLTGSTATFAWTGGTGVVRYWLYVGLSAGAFDFANLDMGTGLTAVVNHLPIDGRTIYVRLFSHIDGAWQYNDYTVKAATLATSQKAELTSPAPGSTLTNSTVTFTWTGGTDVTRYWLDIGSSLFGYDLWSGDMGTSLSAVVSGLPTDGRTLYVRLHSNIYGNWEHNDYTLTAVTSSLSPKAELISPAPGSTLAGSSVNFEWTGGTNVSRYFIYIGTGPGGFDVLSRDMGTALNTVAAGLPVDGRPLYVRLFSLINDAWQYNDYTFTASMAPTPRKAELTTPAPGSTLTSATVTFQWTGGTSVARYWLFVGTTPGGFDLLSRDVGTDLNTVVTDLPTDGSTLYVRLFSHINGNWEYNEYQLKAANIVTKQKAELISPAPGSTLTSSTVTFQWTGGAGVTQYFLYVGSSAGAWDLNARDAGKTLSAVVTDLPTDGRVIYVRLFSLIDGAWQYTDYTLTAAGGGGQ